MSSNVGTIYTNLKNLVGTTLGSSFQELTHTLRLEKNKFGTTAKRYGVRPASVNEVQGQTRSNTVTQAFEIILTESYVSENISDNDLMTKILSLMGKFEDLHKAIINEKGGSPSVFINCVNMSIDNAILVPEEKVIVVQGTFNVLSRVSL